MGGAMISHADEPSGYRPVSGLAVAASIAGLLSAAALLSPLFWVIPLVAIGLACLAMADVSRVGAEKAGRIAALAGLALAVGFAAQAVSSTLTKRLITAARAQAATTLLIDALRDGRVADARAMCLPTAMPKLDELAQRVAACGGTGRPVVSVIGRGEDNPDTWQVRATVEPCAAAPLELIIELGSSIVSGQEGPLERWTVVRCGPPVR